MKTDHESSPQKREEIVAAANAVRERALAGDVAAQVMLARVYERGLPRVGADSQRYPHRALGWYMKAAVAGDGFALTRIKTLIGKVPRFIALAVPDDAESSGAASQGDDGTDRIEQRLE